MRQLQISKAIRNKSVVHMQRIRKTWWRCERRSQSWFVDFNSPVGYLWICSNTHKWTCWIFPREQDAASRRLPLWRSYHLNTCTSATGCVCFLEGPRSARKSCFLCPVCMSEPLELSVRYDHRPAGRMLSYGAWTASLRIKAPLHSQNYITNHLGLS